MEKLYEASRTDFYLIERRSKFVKVVTGGVISLGVASFVVLLYGATVTLVDHQVGS